ncbi:hypothetical protein PPYR_14516 [Photinus pyralis]|uniref:BHLH domain-containing protein n=2 Tax=Photinus pyralis TaxID=7054 RepID=A0A5N4A5H3_PHOPY|nr:transcriptional regulator Myc [Photinus pyralis]XP_031356466.1 transcriptional regulator Myc [Photinus pyralis]KAB0792557.1 hypothetical protein PPYR_14516 [Photinus pyralis]
MLKTDVKTMSDSLDECLADIADIDLDYLYCSAEQLLSEDIWKKFEFDMPVVELDDIFSALDASVPDIFSDSSNDDLCEIRNHDCMWAGHCGSKEHPADELKKLLPQPTLVGIIPPAGVQPKTPAVKQQTIAAGRSVLLKPIVKTPAAPVLPSPESPPISDDEDPSQTSTLKMLNDAINECDLEEDSDLCEYFEEGEDIAEEPEPDVKVEDPQPKPHFAIESDHSYHDHSYHKDKNASMRITNLGIDTPSDSEEEIDVVSINEKQNMCIGRTSFALPTNPSSRDKQQLQRKVASAITGKHITTKHGLKMIPAVRKCTSMSKKRLSETARGVKRTKQHYMTSPYKRRNVSQQANNSSDSEPELEKRSLHNNMERQRRIDLRNSFEDLRMLVPEVSSRERAAKVVILREAALYCDHLGDASESMQRKVVELRRRQEQLRARVSQLRKNLAAKR